MKRLAIALVAWACAAAHAQVTATDAWVRGTVPAQTATGAFMTLKSAQEAKLIGASTPAAKRVEIHETSVKDNVMQMREIDFVALPAGKAVELKPGGAHIMLMGLVKPLAKDEAVPLTLTIEDGSGKRSTVQVTARVRPLAGPGR